MYWYATGYKSHAAAQAALEDMFACGDVCTGERPIIARYTAKNGSTRYGVKLEG